MSEKELLKHTKHLKINGNDETFRAFATDRLLDVLRNNGHTTIKEGCGEGICGACSIILNNKLINSCQTLFGQIRDNDEIITSNIENELMAKIKNAFLESGSVQCGFCTPGMLIASYNLLINNKKPNENDIKNALSGNLCRCTGYKKIIEAVKMASENL